MSGTELIIPGVFCWRSQNFPTNLIFHPSGTGSMVAAVKTASGRDPVVLGKPSKFMFEVIIMNDHHIYHSN